MHTHIIWSQVSVVLLFEAHDGNQVSFRYKDYRKGGHKAQHTKAQNP
jgi:hypothetical protein